MTTHQVRVSSTTIDEPFSVTYAFARELANFPSEPPPGRSLSDADFDRDTASMEKDLARLKYLLENLR